MGDRTGIEWTDATWNPVVGCSKVSQGCKHCYAKTLHDQRHRAVQAGHALARQYAQPFEVVQLMQERLAIPFGWRRPRRVFVNSVSDLFHADVPDWFLDCVFAVMAATPRHTYQVLTKRPERAREYLASPDRLEAIYAAWSSVSGTAPIAEAWPLPNVWLGTSVENQAAADARIPQLLETAVAVRFLSCEPLLGPLRILGHLMEGRAPGRCAACGQGHGFSRCPNTGGISKYIRSVEGGRRLCGEFRRAEFAIAWVIVGGESGPGARPLHPDWARALRDQCVAAEVPFFFKQWGEWAPAPWRVDREAGEADLSYVTRSEAVCATHAVQPTGYLYEAPHRPWSIERTTLPVGPAAMRRSGKRRAGRELDGRTWDEMPATPRAAEVARA